LDQIQNSEFIFYKRNLGLTDRIWHNFGRSQLNRISAWLDVTNSAKFGRISIRVDLA